MAKKVTAGDLVKELTDNALMNGKGMKSTFVNNTLMRCSIPVINGLQEACKVTLQKKGKADAPKLVGKLKGMNISEEEMLKMYREA